jgi:hypothetical protein
MSAMTKNLNTFSAAQPTIYGTAYTIKQKTAKRRSKTIMVVTKFFMMYPFII